MFKIYYFFLLMGFFFITACDETTTPEPLFEYEQSSSGSLQVNQSIDRITLDNPIGFILLNGSSDSTNTTYVLNKTVKVKSSSLAQAEFDKIFFDFSTVAETIDCKINSPAVAFDNYKCSLNINIPPGKDIYVKKNNYGVQTFQLENNLHIETTKGECIVEGHGGSVEATTQSGNINVMVLIPDSGYSQCFSVDGNIIVQVPIGSSGTILLKTTNGTISYSNLNIHNLNQTTKELAGTIGTGSGTIYVESVNGNVLLKGI
jgi:hypothetical protein